MGTLKSQYEVSIWKDIWQGDKFKEQRICTIGSSEMDSQAGIIDPILTRNVNGQKQFSFKMYTQYIDNISGEKIHNPFCDLLTNETKVKLYYKNKWHDFFVKNVIKTLANNECAYQLADALAQELSKNGYDFAFNEYNNIGTAAELGAEALTDTGWEVESEAFVERVEEHLVYVTMPQGAKITKINPPIDKYSGAATGQTVELAKDQIALAFYSSCTTKPHRFQFIYLPDNQDYVNVPTNDKQLITDDDAQYYFDVDNTIEGYYQIEDTNYFLPNHWKLCSGLEDGLGLSLLYRGGRYGYSMAAKYLSKLNRYCNKYTVDGEPYYGYVESQYISPALTTNFITNNEFKDTSGWAASYVAPQSEKSKFLPEITPVFGEFESANTFISVVDMLKVGEFELKESLASYLRVDFQAMDGDNCGYIINSGFYDNRGLLGGLESGEEWTLYLTILDEYGNAGISLDDFDIGICNIKYNPYTDQNELTVLTEVSENIEGGLVLRFDGLAEPWTKEKIADQNLKLVIRPNKLTSATTFYISNAELFKNYYDENGKVLPLNSLSTDGIINNDYTVFSEEAYEKCTSRDDLVVTTIKEKEFSYAKYKPQYAPGCQRVRSLAVEKSNYFNVLQSIAETFECWVDLDVKNRAADGAITEASSKVARFKNYTGEANYAPLRYGLNVTDIQRTFESKQIVSKLIVEPNVNELAKNGYCTVSRAPSNLLGEDTIYDFQYFYSQGMLKQRDYEAAMFYSTNPITKVKEQGVDIKADSTTTNIQNYYNRIKALNVKLQPINEEITALSQDISKLKATKVTEEKLIEAAEQGIEDAKYSIYAITGTSPESIAVTSWDSAECVAYDDDENVLNGLTKIVVSLDEGNKEQQIGPSETPTWKFGVSITGSDEFDTIKEAFSVESAGTTNPYSFTFPYTDFFIGYRYNASTKFKYNAITAQKATFTIIAGKLENTSIAIYTTDLKPLEASTTGTLSTTKLSNGKEYIIEITGDYNAFDFFETPPKIGFTCDKNVSSISGAACLRRSQWALFSLMSREILFTPTIECSKQGESLTFSPKISCTIPAREHTGTASYTLQIANLEDESLLSYLTEYATYLQQLEQSKKNLKEAQEALDSKESKLSTLMEKQQTIINQKKVLHKLFYKTYSRFIMEGTWKNDEYIDDNKYYTDALSVLYNSCYPKAAYNIQVISLHGLPGYELFKYQLGETAYVEDPQFFGTSNKIEVIITGTTENLDDPSKDTITVQNFKNQFQDLFQKLTASVQQTDYKTGSYEKAVALVESDAEERAEFVSAGLSASDGQFSIAGQDNIVQDIEGITLTDPATKKQLKLMGTGILSGHTDPKTGVRVWEKVLSSDGISASALTAGSISTSEVSIMNGKDPTFRWDKYGISAFDADWAGIKDTKPNPYQFVRFDKYGIYGIKSPSEGEKINGTTWKPTGLADIDKTATFSLTWSGLKVTGNEGVEARIGRYGGNIISVTKAGSELLTVNNKGALTVNGKIVTHEGVIANWAIGENSITTGNFGESNSFHMYSTGYKTEDAGNKSYFGQKENKIWTLGIGSNFGVTNEGKLYAVDGNFTGVVNANEGRIGSSTQGFLISDDSLGTYSVVNKDFQGTQISISKGITTSQVYANVFSARTSLPTTSVDASVGAIYFLWPALKLNGEAGWEYYGAVTSRGIQIIYQDNSGKWLLQKTLVAY